MTYRIMMVCTGNICRSAMAEIVLNTHLEKAGINAITVSSGISNEEEGNPIDYRAQLTLKEAGYVVPKRKAQQITTQDIAESDMILAMTYRHYRAIEQLAQHAGIDINAESENNKDMAQERELPMGKPKLMLFREFDPQGKISEPPSGKRKEVGTGKTKDVPDPWYGTQTDFEETLATIERSIPALLTAIKAQVSKN